MGPEVPCASEASVFRPSIVLFAMQSPTKSSTSQEERRLVYSMLLSRRALLLAFGSLLACNRPLPDARPAAPQPRSSDASAPHAVADAEPLLVITARDEARAVPTKL